MIFERGTDQKECRFRERVIQYKCQKEGQMRSEETEPGHKFCLDGKEFGSVSLLMIISHKRLEVFVCFELRLELRA